MDKVLLDAIGQHLQECHRVAVDVGVLKQPAGPVCHDPLGIHVVALVGPTKIRHFRQRVAERNFARIVLNWKCITCSGKSRNDQIGDDTQHIAWLGEARNGHRIAKHIKQPTQRSSWLYGDRGIEETQVMTVPRSKHQPVLAEADDFAISVDRFVSDAEFLQMRRSPAEL